MSHRMYKYQATPGDWRDVSSKDIKAGMKFRQYIEGQPIKHAIGNGIDFNALADAVWNEDAQEYLIVAGEMQSGDIV